MGNGLDKTCETCFGAKAIEPAKSSLNKKINPPKPEPAAERPPKSLNPKPNKPFLSLKTRDLKSLVPNGDRTSL